MTALYDRRAGVTHLLGEPAVMLIDALQAGEGSVDDLGVRLGLDGARALLVERVEELVATGLVERL